MKMGKFMSALIAGCIAFFGFAAIAGANPTQEEVFQSINDNVRSTADFTKAVPYMLVGAGVLILCLLVNYHLKHRKVPRKAYSPSRLSANCAGASACGRSN